MTYDIAADGGLSNRRVWADLGDGVPDGICIDAEGAGGPRTGQVLSIEAQAPAAGWP